MVPPRGRGTGDRGGRLAGPGARGPEIGRSPGTLGRPPVEGGVSVTGTRRAGGKSLSESGGIRPSAESGVPAPQLPPAGRPRDGDLCGVSRRNVLHNVSFSAVTDALTSQPQGVHFPSP